MNAEERIIELDTINISLKYKLSTHLDTLGRLEAEIVSLKRDLSCESQLLTHTRSMLVMERRKVVDLQNSGNSMNDEIIELQHETEVLRKMLTEAETDLNKCIEKLRKG